jgi:hypothetical protein
MSGLGLRRVALGVGAMAAAMVGAPAALAAAPATYTVSTFADGAPGTCSAQVGTTESCTTLRAAVNAAETNGGDPTISLGAGRYVLGGTGGTDGPLGINAPMTIAGDGSAKTTIAQTDGKDGVIFNGASGSQINNVEITGGAASGITSEGGLTLMGDLVDHNTTNPANAYGAGINDDGTLTIAQSTITANTATGGAGADGSGSGNGNSGDGAGGGGISGGGGKLTITDSTISDNIARAGAGGSAVNGTAGGGNSAFGGGLQLAGETVLERDTISGNEAIGGAGGGVTGTGTPGSGADALGGGIELEGTATTTFAIVNTTITGNTAAGGQDGSSQGGGTPGSNFGQGGGVALAEPGEATVANVTLLGNGATGGTETGGGNLYMDQEPGQSLDLADTIIADGTVSSGGTGANCFLKLDPDLEDLGANLEDSGAGTSECGLSPSTDQLVAAGGAGVSTTLANRGGFTDTLPLLAGSPALSAGGACKDPADGLAPLLVDQRGFPRPSGGPCDIGAFQVQPVAQGKVVVAGAAVIGGTLTCTPTGFGPDVSSYTYGWTRGQRTIVGATASTYKLAHADGGLELFCHVIASGIRGTAAAASSGTAVAGYGVPSVKSSKLVVSTSGRFTVDVACGRGSQPCVAALKLSASGRHGAKLGAAALSIRAGHSAAVKLKLSRSELKLLKRKHRLNAVVALSYWHVGDYVTVSHKLTLGTAPKRRSRR